MEKKEKRKRKYKNIWERTGGIWGIRKLEYVWRIGQNDIFLKYHQYRQKKKKKEKKEKQIEHTIICELG